MGTWNNKAFGNDTALDFFAELEISLEPAKAISNILNNVISDGDSCDEEKAVAAIAIITAASYQPIKGVSSEIKSWINIKGFSPCSEIKALALQTLNGILSESELYMCWKETDGLPGWLKQLDKLKKELIAVLDIESPKRKPKKQRLPRAIGKLVDYYLKTNDPKAKSKILENIIAVKDPNSQEKETDYELPLNIAAKAGLKEAVSLLINKGANPNLSSRYGSSPLIVATINNQIEIVDYLLSNGTDLFTTHNTYDEDGHVSRSLKICKAMLSVRNGNAQLVELLEKHGASTREIDLNGETLIFKAAEAGNIELLRYLISRGLDVNQSKSETDIYRGETALHYAVRAKKIESIKILLNSGANINSTEFNLHENNPWCNTPLDLCEEKSNSELYQYLLQNGAKHASELP